MKWLRYLCVSPASLVGLLLGGLALAHARDPYRDNCFAVDACARGRRP